MWYVLLAALGLLWSGKIAAIKATATTGISPDLIVAVSLIGSAGTFAFISVFRQSLPPVNRTTLRFYVLTGLMGFLVPFSLEVLVSPELPVFVFVVLLSTMPILTVILGRITGTEHLKPRQYAAFGIGFCAAVLVALDTTAVSFGSPTSPIWIVLGFAVPALYALNTVFVASQWPQKTDALHVACAQSTIFAAFAAVYVCYKYRTEDMFIQWHGLLGTSVIIACEVLALMLYLHLTKQKGASFVAQANYISIVCAAVIGFLAFDENLTALSALGGIVLITALVLGRQS